MTNFFAYLIGYFFVPITTFFTVLFLVILINEEFNLGVMDRITDTLKPISKKGN